MLSKFLSSNSLEILDYASSIPVSFSDELLTVNTPKSKLTALLLQENNHNDTLATALNPLDENVTNNTVVWTSKITKQLETFPPYAIAIVVVVFFIMSSIFVYYLCRCMARKKKRDKHLATITPKSLDPRLVGIKASQPIQFVVPTGILVGCENTEDSVSETDYSSSSGNMLNLIIGPSRKQSMSKYHINPDDLQHGLYEGVKAATGTGNFLGDLGKVGFSICYNSHRNQLMVKLIGAKDLPCNYLKTTANPCAKMVLLPERTVKYMSKIQRNTTNPVFNETFVFNVRPDDLAQKKIKLSIYDYDKFSRKCFIGQMIYSFKDFGLSDTWTGEIWADLKPDSAVSTHSGNGEMLFSLCYNAPNLTLTILKVRGLNMQQEKGKETSVFVKVTLYVRRKLLRSKKTPSRPKTPQMEFNSSFDVHIPAASLEDVDFLIILCEKSSGLGSRRIIGRTQVGANCLIDQGLQHWQDMRMSPKSTCAQWHNLCI